jgi:hypothetical protein
MESKREFALLAGAFFAPALCDAIYALLSRGTGISYGWFAIPQFVTYCAAGAVVTLNTRRWWVAAIVIIIAGFGDITLGNWVGISLGVENDLPKDLFSVVFACCVSLISTSLVGFLGIGGASIALRVRR